MSSADRRRAHLRVGAAAVGVFLLFLLFGAAHRGASASSTVRAAPAGSVQPGRPAPASPYLPFDRRGGFDDRDGDGGGGFRGGPPDGGGFAAPDSGGGSTL